jgi:hypothetical protein
VAVSTENQATTTEAAGTVAVILARVVVPLWLFAGAVLKLVDLSPSYLPAALIKWLGGNGVDLMFVLRFGIAVELIVAGVMVLVPPLARWAGIVMLGAFLPVLIGDVVLGADSCGCFGSVEVNPWVTLVTDVTFLLGLVFLGRRDPRLALGRFLPTSKVVAAGVWSLLSVLVAFALPADNPTDPSGVTASAAPVPADGYYLPDYEEWIGRPFRDLEIASWISGLPVDLEVGQQYVIFFRKDCEHCHELMEIYFNGSLDWPATAIAVPERDGWPTENLQAFPCVECRMAELPAGIDWFFQTPVLVRLTDGVVECASEVEASAPECIDW